MIRILPFAAGMVVGLMSFTRVLSWFLHHFERAALFAISGVLVASLWVIWPFQARQYVELRGKRRLVGLITESDVFRVLVHEWREKARR